MTPKRQRKKGVLFWRIRYSSAHQSRPLRGRLIISQVRTYSYLRLRRISHTGAHTYHPSDIPANDSDQMSQKRDCIYCISILVPDRRNGYRYYSKFDCEMMRLTFLDYTTNSSVTLSILPQPPPYPSPQRNIFPNASSSY